MNKFLLNAVNAINGKGLYLPLFNFKLGSYFTFFLRKTKGSILSLPNALLFAMLVVFTYNAGAQCTPPSPPTASGTTVNCGDPATLTASGAPSGGDYVWFDDAAGTNQVGTGASFTTPNLSQSTTYYVASSSSSSYLLVKLLIHFLNFN